MGQVSSIASLVTRLLSRPAKLGRERGSILILAALSAVIVIGTAGLAVDVGRMYAARAELAKDVDGASLAGVAELPNVANFTAKVDAYMVANGCVSPCSYSLSADVTNSNLTVNATKPVRLYFLNLFGFNTASVYAHSKAGTGAGQPLDAVLVLDDTASMAGTPISDATTAAKSFVSTVLGNGVGNGNVLIGSTPFRGCWNLPDTNSSCEPTSKVTGLTPNSSTLNTGLSGFTGAGGSGTNICTGLWQGYNVLFNANGIAGTAHHTASNTQRFLVLLSDGGSNYNPGAAVHSTSGVQDSPPSWTAAQAPGTTAAPAAAGNCRIANANQNTADSNTGCTNSESQDGRDLDLDAYKLAQTLKDANNKVEIYTVTFSVCVDNTGKPTAAPCDSTKIGGATAYLHNFTDQNLLKCIASSSSGTNDHFYYASGSSQLNAVFQQIAGRIVNRLIE